MHENEDGSFERSYPSIRDLAAKFDIHRSLIGYHSRRYNWPKQRRAYQAEVKLEFRRAQAKARALSTSDGLAILDAYLEKFREAVESNHVRVDSIADFNTAMRPKEFLQGGADSRQEVQGRISLQEMETRHRRLREEFANLEPELAGVIPAAGGTAGGLAAVVPAAGSAMEGGGAMLQ